MLGVAGYGESHIAVAVHDVHIGNGGEAMLAGSLHVGRSGVARTLVSGVALHYGGVGLLYELLDDVNAEVIGVTPSPVESLAQTRP